MRLSSHQVSQVVKSGPLALGFLVGVPMPGAVLGPVVMGLGVGIDGVEIEKNRHVSSHAQKIECFLKKLGGVRVRPGIRPVHHGPKARRG